MKHAVAILLAVLLLAGFCGTAFADDTIYTEGYFYYKVEDGSITIVGYFGNETEVTIPASIAGIPVNAVAPYTFAGTPVTKVNLPDTVTSYQAEGNPVEVVFDANTDEPYTVEPYVYDLENTEEDNGGNEEGVIDLDEMQEHDALLESVAPEPAPQDAQTETTAPASEAEKTEQEEESEAAAENSPNSVEKNTASLVWIVVTAVVIIACAALFMTRRKK